MLRISIAYGSLITAAIALWVMLDHFVLHFSANLPFLTPVFFNLMAVAAIFLAISSARRLSGGRLTFQKGFKTGLGVSAVYWILASAFFLVLFLAIGPRLLEDESRRFGNAEPARSVLLGSFAGLFFGAVVLGAVYSAIIAALLKDPKR